MRPLSIAALITALAMPAMAAVELPGIKDGVTEIDRGQDPNERSQQQKRRDKQRGKIGGN